MRPGGVSAAMETGQPGPLSLRNYEVADVEFEALKEGPKRMRSPRSFVLTVCAGALSGYAFSLYYVLFTRLPGEWLRDYGALEGMARIGAIAVPLMFVMGGWFCIPLAFAASLGFRVVGRSRGWVPLLALAVAVGAVAGLLLGYLPTLQLIWLEDRSPVALLSWEAHRFALETATEGWAFLAPPCIALSALFGTLYCLASRFANKAA